MSSRSDRGEEQPPVRGVGVIRVFVADDQPIVRRGIMLVLAQEPGIEVVGEAGDGPTTIEQVQALSPHVVLMDIEMSGMSGLEATQHVVESSPDAAVLILTIHDSENYLFQALEAGAQGYILKTAGVDELLWAIKTVRAGEVFIYPRMATKLVSDYVRPRQHRPTRRAAPDAEPPGTAGPTDARREPYEPGDCGHFAPEPIYGADLPTTNHEEAGPAQPDRPAQVRIASRAGQTVALNGV